MLIMPFYMTLHIATVSDTKTVLVEPIKIKEDDLKRRLFELKNIYNENLITKDEYELKRKEIIDKL